MSGAVTNRVRGVRQALRDGTAASHQALDSLWDGKSLAERGHYARFLVASAAALLPIEAALADAGVESLLPDWPLRRRTDAIAADLAGLALPQPCADSAMVVSPPAMFGALYVLEGSRLGGVLLLRQVEASADADVRANRRYLQHGQGGGLWRSFLERLDAADPTPAALDAMIAGARDAFARFDAAARAAMS